MTAIGHLSVNCFNKKNITIAFLFSSLLYKTHLDLEIKHCFHSSYTDISLMGLKWKEKNTNVHK